MNFSKLFFILISVIFSTTLFCQNPLKRNIYTLGGNIDISYSNYDYEKSSEKIFNLSIAPSIGYFITDNILISGKVGFSYYELKYETENIIEKSYYKHFSIGSFFRYYFNAKKFIPFIGAGVDYQKVFQSNFDRTQIYFTGGLNYFLSKEIAFEPFVSYSIILRNNISKSANNLRFGAGISYYIIP